MRERGRERGGRRGEGGREGGRGKVRERGLGEGSHFVYRDGAGLLPDIWKIRISLVIAESVFVRPIVKIWGSSKMTKIR